MLGKCFQKNYEIPLFFRTLQSILGRFKLFKGEIRVVKMVFLCKKNCYTSNIKFKFKLKNLNKNKY